MNETVRIIINGAAGRMGQAMSRVCAGREDVAIVAALGRPDRPPVDGLGTIPGEPGSSGLPEDGSADVLVDFSGASSFEFALQFALEQKIAFVSGTTGLAPSQFAALNEASRSIPTLWAANFSFGVAVLAHLVGEAAHLLPDWDCEIIESHHRFKQDAPSGTALMLGQRAYEARGQANAPPEMDRSGARIAGEIGYATSRGGDIVGEHEVRLAGLGERIELVHRASDRDIFARGALAAACWLVSQAPARYTMADLLGLP